MSRESLVYGHSDDLVYVTGVDDEFVLPRDDTMKLRVNGVVVEATYNGEWSFSVLENGEREGVRVRGVDELVDETNSYSEVVVVPLGDESTVFTADVVY